MSNTKKTVSIQGVYTRSINLLRDGDNLELLQAYLPTSKALQTLEQFTQSLTLKAADDGMDVGGIPSEAQGATQGAVAERSFALIGPYGAGKSAFALFLSALLSSEDSQAHTLTVNKLNDLSPALARTFQQAIRGKRGFLRITVNGIPDSLIRQLLHALSLAVSQAGFSEPLIKSIQEASVSIHGPGATTTMDKVLALIESTQDEWATQGGNGVLIVIDELGKFLEYESYHPQHREIHLLQLLAEHALQNHAAPLHVVVMLHQAFEYYSHRLGKHLREEWQKVQGRYNAIAFLEPAEQTLKVMAAAFVQEQELSEAINKEIDQWTVQFSQMGALPLGLTEVEAKRIFQRCHPLHPVTALILPVLCQKIAQNERTLFSYLGSIELFGFKARLEQLSPGAWISPSELYDYFIGQQTGGFSDPLVYRRWLEVVTALERFDAPIGDTAIPLLKTIGLLNLIGGQRGLKASHELLLILFGDQLDGLLERLKSASIVHFRLYNQEYRVWQGSDFDLNEALASIVAELAEQPIVPILNSLSPIKPIVARRVTITSGSLRSFKLVFASRGYPYPRHNDELAISLYLADEGESGFETAFSGQDIVAVCGFSEHEQLRENILNKIALHELPKRYAALHQDPVAHREYLTWLTNAETEAGASAHVLMSEPHRLNWYFDGKQQTITSRRDLQDRLSTWLETRCYPEAPILRNELIMWEQPSSSASTGRNRLINAMLVAADQEYLGITKTPAEKSLYLSLLKASRLHRQQQGVWGIYPPEPEHDPCRLVPVWSAINTRLGDSGKQIPVPEVYRLLRTRPYGLKLGVLPVLLIAYLLGYRREVALYQEGVYCAQLTMEQAELLCKRPELFAVERFDLGGLRGELFDLYLNSVIGKIPADATMLDIVKPLVSFASKLPDYTKQCKTLSPEAVKVMAAFTQAQSPGTLLFEAIPQALGLAATDFINGERAIVEQCIQKLVGVLRELNEAYDELLCRWQALLSQNLLNENITDLAALRQALANRYHGLETYTPDKMGVGAFIRRLYDTAYPSDRAWLESTAALIGKVPPQKWTDVGRIEAELRLQERSQQLHDLAALRLKLPNKTPDNNALLLRLTDTDGNEINRVMSLTKTQRQAALEKAEAIAAHLSQWNDSEHPAIIAMLISRYFKQS